SAPEAGALESAPDMCVPAHDVPDKASPPVLNHAYDRSLVDAQIIAIDPAEPIDNAPVHEVRHRLIERRVEGIEKPVLGVDRLAVARPHPLQRGNGDLRRKRNGAAKRGRGYGPIVAVARPAGRVGKELPPPPADLAHEVARAVAGGEAEEIFAIARKRAGVFCGVGLLGVDGAAAVFEIVDALDGHVAVANAAEVDPEVTILVAEEGRKLQVRLAPARAPLALEAPGPGLPGAFGNRVARGSQRQHVKQRGFVVLVPVVVDELAAFFRMPA